MRLTIFPKYCKHLVGCMSQFITGNCDICMSQKISVLNEAKQNYVKIKSEALRKISSQNTVKFHLSS